MATEAESLLEVRKSIIESKMAGKSESAKQRALRDFGSMTFTDHADFMSYVDECAGVAPEKVVEASPEDLEGLFVELGLSKPFAKKYVPKPGEASQAEIEDIFKYL